MGAPNTTLMLFQGSQDAVLALKLIRKGIEAGLNMRKSLGVIDTTIDELDYAIRAHMSADPDCCDAGKVWNNADPTSGQFVACETHGEGVA